MPIAGLTDHAPAFPCLGTLRKGAKGEERVSKNGNSYRNVGVDLKDHFRFDARDEETGRLFYQIYGSKPNHIRVMLPYATPDENMEAWMEEYNRSGLNIRCDGQTIHSFVNGNGHRVFGKRPCIAGGGCKCKPTARLMVLVPELQRLGYILVVTTSKYDIMQLSANIRALYALRQNLIGLPMVLSRSPRSISVTNDKGQRSRQEKWLLNVELSPDWVRLQLDADQRRQFADMFVAQLPAPEPSDGDEPEEEELEPEPEPIDEARQKMLDRIVALGGDVEHAKTLGYDALISYGKKLRADAEAKRKQARAEDAQPYVDDTGEVVVEGAVPAYGEPMEYAGTINQIFINDRLLRIDIASGTSDEPLIPCAVFADHDIYQERCFDNEDGRDTWLLKGQNIAVKGTWQQGQDNQGDIFVLDSLEIVEAEEMRAAA